MNRLIIIGNGFDLAHGLPTSYKDFIDDFWKNIETNFKTFECNELISINERFTGFFNYGNNKIVDFTSFIENLTKYSLEYKYRFNANSHTYFSVDHLSKNGDEIIFKFKSEFFREISVKNSENWVDVETEYYKSLIKIAKSETLTEEAKYKEVKKLNYEFKLIKKLLYDYLNKEVCLKYQFNIDESNEIVNYLKDEEINSDLADSYSTLFLSFNYTPLARIYSNYLNSLLIKSEVNYIHGEIGNPENSEIIFGYADDKDENYKLIKSFRENNDFLENIKPFEYNNNDNLENLLKFLNSSNYTVYLIGHSCGLSDKYLLNLIFENQNCDSIKVLFRVYDDGNDDYKNKTMNISRHFDNDSLSGQARIINKKKSTFIPQNIRFEESKSN